ncbi:hypothetical protein A2693_02175 [Candidatus Curtissbacteria bacterium RIFCSPHIGHO2_01_FULL_40_12]|uniref:Uncharacterized protein n=1 Tax=Candidatus Curtissbacteria bacterium RIFCSPHIGHO2_01_FULL_40_12 TaxID=1797710 RepID=A0A1F5GAG1_9BACT|nr:MAG: hypothetical protein A2693_02175 [Candidatus Curtissbacteria bacterium RIFCSPHIGHO2_01_FULL_40_12]
MFQLFSKLWLLFGWFYLLVVVSIIVYFLGNVKLKARVSRFLVVLAAMAAVWITVKLMYAQTSEIHRFFMPVEEKVDLSTFNQASFSKELQKVLSGDDKVCIFDNLAAQYLVQRLYPANPAKVKKAGEDCQWVVSQFEKRPDLAEFEMLEYKGSYLYKLP